MSELIPPPPLLAAGTPEPATPVQTGANAQSSSDMQVELAAFTPLETGPALAEASFPSGLGGLGGLGPSLSPEPAGSSGLNPSAVVEPESVRPGGAGGGGQLSHAQSGPG